MSESLHTEPAKDEFKTESPIRAFTEWQVHGNYAIGKGFRPSLAHTVTYLAKMEEREGWRLVQVLEAATGSPSFVFRQHRVLDDEELIGRLLGDEHFKQAVRDMLAPPSVTVHLDEIKPENVRRFFDGGILPLAVGSTDAIRDAIDRINARREGHVNMMVNDTPAEIVYPTADDPVNPRHYNGTGCAEIIENLPGNLAHAITYIWRAGDKPDQPEKQEIEKAIWFLEREAKLAALYDFDQSDDDEDAAPGLLPGQKDFLTWSHRLRSKKLPSRNVADHPFHQFALERVIALPSWRAEIVMSLVVYAIQRKPGAIVSALRQCHNRITEVTSDFGRQQEP